MHRKQYARMKIIINADDLGISREVNEAIFDLMADNCVTSATLLANAPDIRNAVQLIGRFSSCSFGVHLNISEFAPLSREGGLVLAKKGEMSREVIERVPPQLKTLQAIFEEFSAQILKLIEFGVPVSHIDSHQHVHTIPWVFPALKAVQVRFGIRKVRSTRNIYPPGQTISPGLSMRKKLYNFALRNLYSSRTPEGLTELQTLLQWTAKEAQRFRTLEVMVHPGASAQEKDVAILRTPWMKSLPFASEAVTYNGL